MGPRPGSGVGRERTRAGGGRRVERGLILVIAGRSMREDGESLLACVLRLVGSDIREDECES